LLQQTNKLANKMSNTQLKQSPMALRFSFINVCSFFVTFLVFLFSLIPIYSLCFLFLFFFSFLLPLVVFCFCVSFLLYCQFNSLCVKQLIIHHTLNYYFLIYSLLCCLRTLFTCQCDQKIFLFFPSQNK